ncbi:ovoinhibitor-like [Contarinia nasturtii]|uniref:ovoinhibitor-like n=1 Tax=Contarinia nasturtii TaxID=265458 RepID=UPI0012D463A2|nr:ovoinhibitor-like [Contarinia nasturtii]
MNYFAVIFAAIAIVLATVNCTPYGYGYPQSNPNEYHPVCGNDGVTYQNDFWFRKAANYRQGLGMKHDGECDRSDVPFCDCSGGEVVCGSDGVTYTNYCTVYKCAQNYGSHLVVEHEGNCNGY